MVKMMLKKKNKATINLLAKMFVYMHARDKERR